MCVRSTLSCNPGFDYYDLPALTHPFNICGRFGLCSLQRKPVGNHVIGIAFIGIDFNNEADFGFI